MRRARPGARAPLRIVFGGAFARTPGQGGLVWMVLQWVLGLRRLGHRVTLIEPIAEGDLSSPAAPLDASEPAACFREAARAFGLEGDAALVCAGRPETVGLDAARVLRAIAEADLVIDIAGGLSVPGLGLAAAIETVPVRLYLDVDPGFTQLWQAVEEIDMRFAPYSHFATVGLAFEHGRHTVPDCGRRWMATAQPVVLEHWPVTPGPRGAPLTTVAHWRSYGSIEVAGVHYGQKAHSLRRVIDLPRRCGAPIELALAIDPGERDDLAALAAYGWRLRPPATVTSTAADYRRYIQGSRGELGIAKSGYVESRCGWFSDRSVCYLASGRPVIAQDTGFGAALPVGEGLFAFRNGDDVAAAIEELERDEPRHRRAARALAEECFASDRVVGRLLERVGVAA